MKSRDEHVPHLLLGTELQPLTPVQWETSVSLLSAVLLVRQMLSPNSLREPILKLHANSSR